MRNVPTLMGSVDEHVQEVAVAGHRLVEGMTPGAEVPADSARGEQRERPSWSTEKPEIVPLPAFAVYA